MNSFDQTFEQRLRAEVRTIRDRRAEDVARGVPTEVYQREVGAISAFDEVLALCESIRKAMTHD